MVSALMRRTFDATDGVMTIEATEESESKPDRNATSIVCYVRQGFETVPSDNRYQS